MNACATIAWPLMTWLWLEFRHTRTHMCGRKDKNGRAVYNFWVVEVCTLLRICYAKGQECDGKVQTVPRPETTIHCCEHITQQHLQRQHANTKLVAKDSRTQSDAQAECMPTPTKQPKLDFQQVTLTKAEMNRLVASYIIEEMLPVSTVESSSFRNILSKIPITGNGWSPSSDRKTFMSYLDLLMLMLCQDGNWAKENVWELRLCVYYRWHLD